MTGPTTTMSIPQRAKCSHTPQWQRFQSIVDPNTYQRQYTHVYHHRLQALGPLVGKSIPSSNSSLHRVARILDLRENIANSVVVGTLVQEDDDIFVLEDSSGRVALDLAQTPPSVHCTGLVLGIQGTVLDRGVLQATHVYWPTPTLPPPLPTTTLTTPAPHILFVSGLQCGNPDVSTLKQDMLLTYLQGHWTDDRAAHIARMVVLGGSIDSNHVLEGCHELDAWLSQVLRMMQVDILPGQDDPTTANWPQQPLHASLLPKSASRLTRTPNPYAARLQDDVRLVATDGTNVRDLVHHSHIRERQAMETTLRACHICPTGPSSVPTVPHAEHDPMVLTEQPHLYVTGNASQFDTHLLDQRTRLICVPEFAKTGQAVLVHLQTLQVQLLQFQDDQA